MRTLLPLGALLALAIAACSNSADLLIGPGEDTKPTMDPVPNPPGPVAPSPWDYTVVRRGP
jgi:hypothetical protein